jgi:hypothetical protein
MRARGTGLYAGEAFQTLAAVVPDKATRHAERASGANIEATTADFGREATRGIEGMFGFEALRFWVAAPAATQGTAFEKDESADPLTVMYGKFLHVKHNAAYLRVLHERIFLLFNGLNLLLCEQPRQRLKQVTSIYR